MHSFHPQKISGLTFSPAQAATLRAIGECRGRQALFYQQAPEILKQLRESAVIESAESSNRLEGITVRKGRLAPLIEKTTDPRDRSEQELAGYRDALGLIHDNAHDMTMSPNIVLQLHQTLFRYLPNPGGQWKATNNEIVETGVDGERRVRFTPTPAHLVPAHMEQLASQFNTLRAQETYDPLLLIPLLVLDFLCIHPFTDGNGRIARLITLKLLYQAGYEVGRYISLERVIEDSKESYYETLGQSSQGWHEAQHDPMPWLNYFWGVLLAAYREFEKRVSVLPAGRGSKTEQVRLAVINRTTPFAISEIEAECKSVSHDMVRHVLRQMKEEGVIRAIGRGRGAKWELVQPATTTE
ncbi:MAG: Fic family protein [Pseudomonadales bacterium]|nr:Fic family protein [Pseudomonadales bacterium]